MEILLATHNQHKADEIRQILPENFDLKTLNDIGFKEEIIENGKTFEENALIKAKKGYEVAGIPTFADDSGLCVNALGGAPGIYSARYTGSGISEDNITKLLSELGKHQDRTAYFNSVITLYDGGNVTNFEGRINGLIMKEKKGEKGFGYDPIFLPNGYQESFGEMSNEEKNRISHRAQALKKFIGYLNKYY